MDRDEQLARLLDQLAAHSRSGRLPDLEVVFDGNPELKAELRELWATMVLADDFASFTGGFDTLAVDALSDQRLSPAAPIPDRVGDFELLEEIGHNLSKRLVFPFRIDAI